jgi:hypothetical protein
MRSLAEMDCATGYRFPLMGCGVERDLERGECAHTRGDQRATGARIAVILSCPHRHLPALLQRCARNRRHREYTSGLPLPPPSAPLAREAAVFASDFARPPLRPRARAALLIASISVTYPKRLAIAMIIVPINKRPFKYPSD